MARIRSEHTRPSRVPQLLSGALVAGMVVLGMAVPAQAAPGDEVVFTDTNLKTCIADQLGVSADDPITEGQLASLTTLTCDGDGIVDITPLSYATNLTDLDLNRNAIVDVSPLAGLTTLTALYLPGNAIVDVSPLTTLTALTTLYLPGNQIVDVSPLASLTALTNLVLENNAIVDVSPLASLTTLTRLYLPGNQMVDVSPLASLTALTDLALDGNAIVDVSPLASLTALTILTLNDNAIVDVSPLAGLTALTILTLNDNAIVDVSPLAGLTTLNTLILNDNAIADVSPLADLTDLTDLDLFGQVLAPANAVVGVASATPVLDEAGAVVPMVVASGTGTVSGGEVTWTASGNGSLSWSIPVRGGTFAGVAPYVIADPPVPGVAPTLDGVPTDGVVGASYSYAFATTGAPSVRVTAGTLPDGLPLSTDGVLSGTPTAAGTFTFTLTASNGTAPDAVLNDVTITVTPPATSPPQSAGGSLAQTGMDGLLPLSIGGAVVLLLGAAITLIARRRIRNTNA